MGSWAAMIDYDDYTEKKYEWFVNHCGILFERGEAFFLG